MKKIKKNISGAVASVGARLSSSSWPCTHTLYSNLHTTCQSFWSSEKCADTVARSGLWISACTSTLWLFIVCVHMSVLPVLVCMFVCECVCAPPRHRCPSSSLLLHVHACGLCLPQPKAPCLQPSTACATSRMWTARPHALSGWLARCRSISWAIRSQARTWLQVSCSVIGCVC